MKKYTITLTFFIIFFTAHVNANNNVTKQSDEYHYQLDLTKSTDDQFHVELVTPRIKQNEIVFHIPKTAPGTYSDDNYGHFIASFTAYDQKGNSLPVTRINTNAWSIGNARSLFKISYTVNDTYNDESRERKVFEPTGTNIMHDSVYVINTHAVFGYFKGMELNQFNIVINHTAEQYGSTALDDKDSSPTVDRYEVTGYPTLADYPMMYCRPDTTTIEVGGAKILVSVYSPNKKIRSSFLAQQLDALTKAQVQYLGGKLPVNKYAYLIYLFDQQPNSRLSGALEHSTSSMYSMNEVAEEVFAQGFKDIAAHEFFHIVTPLNIHAEQIHYFDFNDPQMSKHLWLYEGSTEYHAHKSQLENGLISVDRFLSVLGAKITNSLQGFKDSLSFTEMSRRILEPEFAPQFGNVYQKGALINMCLDIRLKQLSDGKMGLIDLILALSKKFGKHKPFKDEDLFTEIKKITYPEIEQFLVKYVEGNQPLPLDEIFKSVGIRWIKDTTVKAFSMGKFNGRVGEDGRVAIRSVNNLDDFGKEMSYQVGDTIVAINGKRLSGIDYFIIIQELATKARERDLLTVEIIRKVNGVPQNITISKPLLFVDQKRFNLLRLKSDADEGQVKLRNQWFDIQQINKTQ